MKLELLANELLLELFEFLHFVHLLRAFHGLNSRFNDLLCSHVRSNSLGFRSVSKNDFDIFCQEHLPLIVDRIVSVRLSDEVKTLRQTALFFSHNLNLRQFINLQSLTLSHIRLDGMMNKMMDGIYYLSHLTYLSILRCDFGSAYADSIWRLPKLTHLNLHHVAYSSLSLEPTLTSLSLKSLSLLGAKYHQGSLQHLFDYTPGLQSLAIAPIIGNNCQRLLHPILSIEILKLSYDH